MDSEQRWPRISLVTAVYNGEDLLEDTFRSIFAQGYPNLEYIVVNDGSTDGTREIIGRYEDRIARVVDQPNRGLYAALNTGFAESTGDILGWLNCSDMLNTHGLLTVGTVFSSFPEVEWITGRAVSFNPAGVPATVRPLRRWSRLRFLLGANRYIQQESTYWRRSLWERAGGELSTKYRAEGDFELWVRFFRHARLHSVNALIAGYRHHDDSLSHSDIGNYDRNCAEIVENELAQTRGGAAIRVFRSLGRLMPLALRALYRLPGPDRPPWIGYTEGEGWSMRSGRAK